MTSAYLQAVSNASTLTDAEYKQLLLEYRTHNDTDALKTLTLSMGKLIMKAARKMCRYRFCKGIDFDDFVQAGNEGVMCAIRNFRGDSSFVSYSLLWIKGKQWRLVQKMNIIDPKLVHMSRKHRGKFFYNLASLVDIINAWNPDEKVKLRQEFSNKLSIPIDIVLKVEARYSSISCTELFEDRVSDLTCIDHNLDYAMLKDAVKNSINKLKEEHKTIIVERFFKDPPKTNSTLARELGVHRRTVDQRRVYALQALKSEFNRNPIIQELM